MTATDELRHLLDERGVERVDAEDGHTQHTWWSDGDHEIAASNSGERLAVYNLTPEQAIEATLGPAVLPPPAPDQPPYDVLLDILASEWGIDASWDGLRGFWCVELNDEGVRKRDEREATLGRGTCHDEGDPGDFCCSECGVRLFMDTSDTYTMIASDGRTIIEHPNYCPNCGRRVEQ